MTTIIRPGQRIVNIPGIGLRVSRRAVSAGGGNWWEAGGATGAVAVYQPKGAASLAASYINLANPGTYDAAPGTAPSFDAGTGWTFNGATQYLTTGLTPVNDQTWSALVQFANVNVGGNNALFGCNKGSAPYYSFELLNGWFGASVYYGNGGTLIVSGALSSGNLGFAGATAYRNGVAESSTIPASAGALGPVMIGVLGYLNNTPWTGYVSGDIVALAFYSGTLSAAQMAAVSAAMAAL